MAARAQVQLPSTCQLVRMPTTKVGMTRAANVSEQIRTSQYRRQAKARQVQVRLNWLAFVCSVLV